MEQLFYVTADTDNESKLRVVRGFVKGQMFADDVDVEIISRMLGFRSDSDILDSMTEEELENDTCSLVRRILKVRCSAVPVTPLTAAQAMWAMRKFCIIIEGSNEMDVQSWRTISELIGSGLLIVLELTPVFDNDRNARLIRDVKSTVGVDTMLLGGLSQLGIKKIGCHCLKVSDISSDISEFICVRTKGNPLHAQEWFRSMNASGTCFVDNGAFLPASPFDFMVSPLCPPIVNGMMSSTFDKISTSQQNVLKVAAVVGPTFCPEDILQFYPTKSLIIAHSKKAILNTIIRDLDTLEALQCIRKANATVAVKAMGCPLTQQIPYMSLPPTDGIERTESLDPRGLDYFE